MRSEFNPTNKAAPATDMTSHRVRVALFFHRARFQIQYAAHTAIATVLLRRELIFHLFQVIRMNKLKQRVAIPLVGRIREHLFDRIANIDYVARVALGHEQKAVRGLQYQMLELLVGEERGLVRVVIAQTVRIVAI